MTINYTPEQQHAITNRGQNLLVSAAAGSGKTQVLIERIVRMVVEDRIPLERMVVVTFTNAAAGEMKARLSQGLQTALLERPEDASYLSAQIRALPAANVSTLHAYCIKTMRNYYQVIGLPADFRVASDAGQTVLKEQALEATMDAFYEAYEEGDPFYRLVEAYGGKNSDQGVQQMIRRLANFLRTLADGETWLKEAMAPYRASDKIPDEDDPFLIMLQGVIEEGLEEASALLDLAEKILPQEGILTPYLETLAKDRDLLQGIRDSLQSAGFLPKSIAYSRLPYIKKDNMTASEEALSVDYKVLRDRFKNTLKKSLDLLPKGGLEKVRVDRARVLPHLETLIELCRDYQVRYQALKADRHEVDYNDLEHAMLDILAVPEARDAIRSGIDVIFFDEYQDANEVQEAIVNILAPDQGLFYVGDVKQAIYSFRFADPGIFNRRKEAYEKGEEGRVIHLADNFRSVRPILDFANALFADLMTPELGQVDYLEPGQALQAHRELEEEEEAVEVILLEREEEQGKVAEGEARWIAQEAKRLVDEGHYAYSDMAVLIRSPGRDLASYEKAFKEEDIPFYSDNSSVDFSNMEVRVFHHMLQVLHNDHQDIPLASILLSPFGGLDEADLAQIRLHAPDSFFYEAARSYAHEKENPLASKLRDFYTAIALWRKKLTRQPVADVAELILEESGYGAFLIALDQGADRLENVQAFIGRIRDFDEDSGAGLAGFLTYADLLKKRQGDRLTPSIGLSAQDDRLQLMSIHKSKGLGFKVVFLADMARSFNFRDSYQDLILRRQEGIALKVVNLEQSTYHFPMERELLRLSIERDTRSEELRLLYVAITRAKDKIYLLATVPDIEEAFAKAAQEVEVAPGHKARSFADWFFGRIAKNPELSRLSRQSLESQGLYRLTLQNVSDLQNQADRQEADLARFDAHELDPDLQAHISERLDYIYPYLEASQRPVKTTVTALNEAWIAKAPILPISQEGEEDTSSAEQDFPIPGFLEGDRPLLGREAGSLLHDVLQWIPFDAKKEDLPVLLDQYMQEGKLSEEARRLLGSARPIANFLDHPLSQKAARAGDQVQRELSFTMHYNGMIIDGQMDLVFRDEEGLHLVDFKSDRIPRPERYVPQIALYARALEKAWGESVTSAHIFWLRQGSVDTLGPEDWCLPEIAIEDSGTLPFD